MSNLMRAVSFACPTRLAAASPRLVLGDPMRNAERIIEVIKRAEELNVHYLALPELCLCGATVGTLLSHPVVLGTTSQALRKICAQTRHTNVTVGIGLPYPINGNVYSCTAVICSGRVYAIVPSSGAANPFGFLPELERCSPSKLPIAPISRLAVGFGNELFDGIREAREGYLMLMPSSLNATAQSHTKVLSALAASSARSGMAIAYAASDMGESTSAFVFDGVCAIAAQGEILVSSEPLTEDAFVYADVNMDQLSSFEPFDEEEGEDWYISREPQKKKQELQRILDLQAVALERRLKHINGKGFVLGVSGGLDSTLALMAAVLAAERMGLERSAVLGVSMPGFGTSKHTRANAKELIEALGCAYREIDIRESCRRHFADIGHDENVHNIVFENAQARERTKILLSIANGEGLLDVGTGDLSEGALGWTTFGGDHLALYGINASIPKTILREVVSEAKYRFPDAADVIDAIVATPISPELLPLKDDGSIAQRTEDSIGAYELHDFFIYHMIVTGKGPKELYAMACDSLPFPKGEVKRVLGIFLTRFFAQQYKRASAPEYPHIVLSIAPALFNMPSDMAGGAWMNEFNEIP